MLITITNIQENRYGFLIQSKELTTQIKAYPWVQKMQEETIKKKENFAIALDYRNLYVWLNMKRMEKTFCQSKS